MTIWLRTLPALRSPLAVVGALAVLAVATACGPPPPKLTGKPGPVTERVTVSQFRDLEAGVQYAAFNAAAEIKAGAALLHGGTIGLRGLYRNGVAYALAPINGQYPMGSAAVDPASATELYGADVGRFLAAGSIVLSATSAGLFGARVGDVAELRRWSDGGLTRLTIVGIVPDERLPAEMVLPTSTAAAIGFVRPSSVQIYGFKSVKAVDDALAKHGLRRSDVRIGHPNSDPSSPDSTLGLLEIKVKLGQFWYVPRGNGAITIDPAWAQANLVRVAFTGVGVVATCHRVIVPYLQAAFTEIAAAGLAGAIDTANTNRYGGCYGPREVRASGGTTGGNLSRHTWAMALDANTATNPMGGTPTMDCRVVRIFRKHGFAWGGNFLTPDGMHFEWVGEDRSKINYPSRYCPNIVGGGAAAAEAAPSRPPTMQEPYEEE
jgi:D-alanyl-D-alanine carboxypeptidase